MDIGLLRDRVSLLKRTKTADDSGGYALTYPESKKLWGQRLVPSFRQQVIQGGVQSVEQVQARIRKGSGALIGDHIGWTDGTEYEIIAIDDTAADSDVLGLKVFKRRGA